MEIKYSEDVKLVVNITDQMVRDFQECKRAASTKKSGKDCEGCSLDTEIEGEALCVMSVVTEELEKRVPDRDMDKITTEMMEHLCDNLCRYPEKAADQEVLEDICAECKMGEYVCDILNQYNKVKECEVHE